MADDNLSAEARYIAALWLVKAARLAHRRQLTLLRPAILLDATIDECFDATLDCRYFVASAAGLLAVGDTPDDAYEAFDRLWVTGSQFESDQSESEACQ